MISSSSRFHSFVATGVAVALAISACGAHAAPPKIRPPADIKAAAEQGDIASQVKFASICFMGTDTDTGVNYEEAAKWFASAADKGDTKAQIAIAWMRYLGAGVSRDYVAACTFLPKSAVPGSEFIGLSYFTPSHWPEEFGVLTDAYWQSVMKEIAITDPWPIDVTQGFKGDELRPGSADRIPQIETLADKGNLDAQYLFAQLCARGLGVPKDMDRARELFAKAAEQGDDQAQIVLGGMYADGVGVPKDLAVTRQWMTKATAKNNSWAFLGMAAFYREGSGPDENLPKAAEWVAKSADRGNTMATYLLAGLYRDGKGLQKDEEKAKALYRKAAELGNSDALNELKTLEPGANEEQIKATRALANMAFLADHGDITSQFTLGIIYTTNVSDNSKPAEEIAKGIHYLTLAADQGEPFCQYQLGRIYLKGDGVPKDYAKAAALITKCADTGDTTAENQLAEMYRDGQGFPKDNVKAYMWFNIAASRGNSVSGDSRDALEKTMKPEDVVQAQKFSSEWMENFRKNQDAAN